MRNALATGSVGSGNLTGSMTGWSPAYGGTPSVPNPGATAGSAVASNLGNLGQIYNLGSSVNSFNVGQMTSALNSMIPNYSGLMQQQSGNIASELSGNLPSDVMNQILTSAAERGISTGSPGSGNANAAMLHALGLTSLNMTQMGQQGLQTAIGETPLPQMFNPQSMFVTPDQVQSAQMAANMYASAPNPKAAAGAAMAAASAGYGAGSLPVGTYHSAPYVGSAPAMGHTSAPEFMGQIYTAGATGVPDQTDPNQAWKDWYSSFPTNSIANQAGTGTGQFYAGPSEGYYDDALAAYTGESPEDY